jgi:hypothetical protein
MQLSVFLTPILAHEIGIGYGVCEELAVISPASEPSSLTSSTAHHAQMSAMSMADMPDMMDMQPKQPAKSTAITSQNPTSKSTPATEQTHDSHHGQCDFCLLFGHSVLPPFLIISPLLAPIAITVSSAKIRALKLFSIAQNKTLRPQGRAPPQFIL